MSNKPNTFVANGDTCEDQWGLTNYLCGACFIRIIYDINYCDRFLSEIFFSVSHLDKLYAHTLSPSTPSLSLFPPAVFFFLSGDLSRETLSKDSEQKRTKYAKVLEELLNKIQLHQPAHLNGEADIPHKPPPPFPPPSITVDTPPNPEPPMPDHEPTDYLAFEPSPLDPGEPQEVYEAMENTEELSQELYVDTSELLCTHFSSFLGKV